MFGINITMAQQKLDMTDTQVQLSTSKKYMMYNIYAYIGYFWPAFYDINYFKVQNKNFKNLKKKLFGKFSSRAPLKLKALFHYLTSISSRCDGEGGTTLCIFKKKKKEDKNQSS